jgi:hypothetical protein
MSAHERGDPGDQVLDGEHLELAGLLIQRAGARQAAAEGAEQIDARSSTTRSMSFKARRSTGRPCRRSCASMASGL